MTVKPKRKSKSTEVRGKVIGVGFSFLILLIAAKAIDLQIFKNEWLSEKVKGQVQRPMITRGKRGVIYDANYKELAVTLDTDSIGIHPKQVPDIEKAALDLSKTLQFNRKEIKAKLMTDQPFIWIKRQIDPSQKTQIEALKQPGVVFVPDPRRFYPQRTLAAQVIGFSGLDGNGLEGIECSYNRYLEGKELKSEVLRDARGRGFSPIKGSLADTAGSNIILTIDDKTQVSTEASLAQAVTEFNGKSGIAVVMDPKTGAVLAMAHYPTFNPNSYSKFDRETWRNRAISDSYEPGSTMKIFTASAAIESGLLNPASRFYCEEGSYHLGRATLHDTHKYGELTLSEIVKFSSNIGAAKVAEKIGNKTLGKQLVAFGFGEKLGVDLPGEAPGQLRSYNRWKPIEMATIAFGQGVAVTALQVITAASAIANGGDLMQPYLVKAITDTNGCLIQKTEPKVIQKVMSEKTAHSIRDMMRSVVEEEGTGTNAQMEGYTVGGKTGTAQKVGPGGRYEGGKFIASFVGMFPWEDPAVVILVIVDEPGPKHYGGTVAAPAFKRIAEDLAIQMNIRPDVEPKGNPSIVSTVSAHGGMG
jgi:cell division protein FtsI (penicillin-binding protein 3)